MAKFGTSDPAAPRAGTVRRVVVALAMVGMVVAGGCGRGGSAGGGGPVAAGPSGPVWSPIPSAARIYYDNSGGIRDSLRLVVRDNATLNQVWTQATSGQTSPPPAPTIDFGREMLIVVGAGRKTAEEQIRVDSLAVQRVPAAGGEQTLFAVIRLTEGCQRFNIDAYPLEIVRVNRFEGPVEFVERRSRSEDCPLGE